MPLSSPMGSVLAFNGEIYSGLPEASPDLSDSEVLLRQLDGAESEGEIVSVLSALRGPWSLVLWHAATQRLWFGRDVLGRRSLLYRPPSLDNPSFILTSVAPSSGGSLSSSAGLPSPCGAGEEDEDSPGNAPADEEYRELPPGIFSFAYQSQSSTRLETDLSKGPSPLLHILDLPASEAAPSFMISRHHWTDEAIRSIESAQRTPTPQNSIDPLLASAEPHVVVLGLLNRAVREQCLTIAPNAPCSILPSVSPSPSPSPSLPDAPVCLLFSGGLDSTLLAALATRHIDPRHPIDLINVCFDAGKSPDREAALCALGELAAHDPHRSWRLVCIDQTMADVSAAQDRLSRLLYPRSSVMDLNIGAALWLSAQREGRVIFRHGEGTVEELPGLYRSRARVCLLGTGADEVFGGYSRFRTVHRDAGLAGLELEIQKDIRNLWLKNLGRDDRIVADTCRETRHPFLDESLLHWALSQPISRLCDLDLPLGVGDKKVLRDALASLGSFPLAMGRVKRAIQFGTRLGKKYNQLVYGSNRKANKFSAGGNKATAV